MGIESLDLKKPFTLGEFFMEFESKNRVRLRAIIRAKVPEDDVHDTYQNALLSIWLTFTRAIRHQGRIQSPTGLAVRVTQREVVDYWRARSRRPLELPLLVDPPDPAPVKQEVEEQKIVSMTPSEKEVFCLIGLGLRNAAIAGRLHVSIDTVRSHVKKVYKKTEFRDRAALALFSSKYFKPKGGKV